QSGAKQGTVGSSKAMVTRLAPRASSCSGGRPSGLASAAATAASRSGAAGIFVATPASASIVPSGRVTSTKRVPKTIEVCMGRAYASEGQPLRPFHQHEVGGLAREQARHADCAVGHVGRLLLLRARVDQEQRRAGPGV